ncbi:MAG TPA: AbrB/MazE/SpoVT family DNA-binding domain-containing protein [Nitriliruptorales bacterium]
MKSTGIRRKVDDLGRVVIPAGIRRSLGIREGDQIEVYVEGDQVILAKPVDRCVFCQAEDDLQPYREKVVCRSCVASVGVLDENLRRRRTQAAGTAPRHVQAVPDDARPDQPLPPWTDPGRPRPAPAAEEPEQPEPDVPAAPQHPAAERRLDDPPASTAW